MNMSRVGVQYRQHVRRRLTFIGLLALATVLVAGWSLQVGPYPLDWRALWGREASSTATVVLWHLRVPRIVAALLVGSALAMAGAVMQCVLRNPLASPFTLGVSQGAMFGAAFVIGVLGVGWGESSGYIGIREPMPVVTGALTGALLGMGVILLLAQTRGLTPEAIVLAGVAMSSLFTAATTLIQYFTEEEALVAIVYWTFGDLGRAGWRELGWLGGISLVLGMYLLSQRWSLNALESGDEVARSLGVHVTRVRLFTLLAAGILTAVSVAFVGIIGFVGLICPHLVRLVIGGDYRFVLPASALMGAFLLLLADVGARLVIAPEVLPVGVLTSFLGAPMFLYLLSRR
ncbi:MAG: iron ABC transporter permease [Chloroflexi bacterium]|nr:iron ABC transporter permease [Chloroflexota bacterium]